MKLTDIRRKIDAIDDQLLKLLNERADLVHEVGLVKRAEGSEIYAPEREEAVLRSLTEKNAQLQGRLPEKSIRAIYREIMSASLALEKDLTIAYFGPESTNTHQAARSKFGASVNYTPKTTISDVFDVVARGNADYGVVPIENSTEGAVNHTLDVFMESELRICAQVLMKIENHLVANIPREKIKRVYSHPQVFGQCRNWLRQNLPHVELIEVSSTARAAELAAGEADAAAITGPMAAETHGLQILAPSIQDIATNTTRFLVIGKTPSPPTGDDRTSLMFCVQDKPGALFHALEPFNRLKISMSKIESRPSKRKAWEYFFFVDIDGHASEEKVQQALEGLSQHCTFVKILGTYPKTLPT
ncbi:chorismate mutase [Chthoniobacter flavus Ellin428]|uniref:Bifunctional chorismate mutase/prephenate dehydratase n=1 Tax=Chthoniobacter flavus Ellin428 TaxID=497964 RepID=B4D7X9_9BACT|nr:prephenate dehydratase [Chthoniobacter flavus]EDY17502.1 chorismate mutase [Chthoniobacter flavus Ellin428]TCO92297.1 chorismate mutase [Chthoniobacter flavus]